MALRSRGAVGLLLGAVLLVARMPAAAPAIDWTHAETLRIVMVDYRFLPPRLALRRGRPYRLIFANHAKAEWHEFTASKFLNSVVLGNPKALDAAHSELAVPPGATRELYVLPRVSGRWHFYCSDHDWAGMEGTITVK